MNERIRAIINEVHDVTGIKLQITDPEPAILLAQHRFFEILQQQMICPRIDGHRLT